MKAFITALAATLAFAGVSASVVSSPTGKSNSEQPFQLQEFVLTGKKPLDDIGVVKTEFDSLALRENIALSMADVLSFNSSAYIKSYGRATLSTISFRGTSPSHTQVTWNGMRINSPMLGMTDFSTIPSFFIDRASMLHGASSVNETGGGLGGAVVLDNTSPRLRGLNLQYVQGIGSFKTFDEFLRLEYAGSRWSTRTRVSYSSSPNDYTYTNHDKKILVYDDDHNVVGSYYPKEKNRNGAYKDFHALQELSFDLNATDRLDLNAWFMASNRELPLLTTDYSQTLFENRQRENTFRGILGWTHSSHLWNASAKFGYTHTWMRYLYKRDPGSGTMSVLNDSRSLVNSFYLFGNADWKPTNSWRLSANLSGYHHSVKSSDLNFSSGNAMWPNGYNQSRYELSASVSAKWHATDRFGASLVVREEMAGKHWSLPVPAIFLDALLCPTGNITARASATRNHRFPTLNDLYFLPGGNPDLKAENGFSYDFGLGFGVEKSAYDLSGSLTWFDSYINDWIIWLPTVKGFFSPKNVKRVHAYGVEVKLNSGIAPAPGWFLDLGATYSWTPSINDGEPTSDADRSVGKQLPYVPKHSASATGRISWRGWSFLYKWCWYSRRHTMSSNDITITGNLPSYFMSNVALEKRLSFSWADLNLSAAVNNLFNRDYISVLGRPMPGINFEFFVSITPHFGGKKTSTPQP